MTDWEPTACILCSENCGLEVKTEGRRIAAVRGDAARATAIRSPRPPSTRPSRCG